MRNLLLLSLLFLTINARELTYIRNDMSASLLAKVSEYREAPDISNLMSNLASTGANLIGQLKTEAEIDTLCSQRGLPGEISSALKNALNSKAENRNIDLVYRSQPNHLSMSEIIGVCRYEESQLHYIIIIANTNGQATTIIETKYRNECTTYRRHFKKHRICWDEPYEEARANNDAEIATMRKACLSRSIEYIENQYYQIKESISKDIRDTEVKKSGISPEQTTVNIYSPEKKIGFIQNLRNLVDNSRQLPSGYENLIKNIRTYSYINMDTFTVQNAKSVIEKYDLPGEVKTELNTLSCMSGDIAKKEIVFMTDNNIAYLLEVLGIFSKVGNNLFFIYIKSESMGDVPTSRKKLVDKEFCYHEWLKKKCKTYKEAVDDPLQTHEIATIKNALKALNMQAIGKKLSAMDESQTLLSEKIKIISSNKMYAATMGNNGIIYVGKADNPIGSVMHQIGAVQPPENSPYSFMVTDHGNMYIINKNGAKVWSTNTSYAGVAPYKVIVDDSGILTIKDSQDKAVYMAK